LHYAVILEVMRPASPKDLLFLHAFEFAFELALFRLAQTLQFRVCVAAGHPKRERNISIFLSSHSLRFFSAFLPSISAPSAPLR
jgi:hypothetical protein